MSFTIKEASLLKPYRKSFSAGSWLFREGESSKETFILLSGQIDISKKNKNIISLKAEGTVFGEMATILGGSRTASARAAVKSDCIVIAPENLENCISTTPSVALKIMRTLATRLSITTAEYIESLHENELMKVELSRKPAKSAEKEEQPLSSAKSALSQKDNAIQSDAPPQKKSFIEIMARFPTEELMQTMAVLVSNRFLKIHRNKFEKVQESMQRFSKEAKAASVATPPMNYKNLLKVAVKYEVREEYEMKILENYKMAFSNLSDPG